MISTSVVHILPVGSAWVIWWGRYPSPVAPSTTNSGKTMVPMGVSFSKAPVMPTTTTLVNLDLLQQAFEPFGGEPGAHAGHDRHDLALPEGTLIGIERSELGLLRRELLLERRELHWHGAHKGDSSGHGAETLTPIA